MLKKFLCLSACVGICFFMSVMYTYSVSKDLHDNIVRLHVIANSNSQVDQRIKYMVRDELLRNSKYLQENDFSSDDIIKIAKGVLEENNAGYIAYCEKGDFYFPKKSYENITMPEGIYSGVKIILGDGSGENWWCVLSPPMCFTQGVLGEVNLDDALHADTVDVISDNGGINYKFGIVELVKKIIR